MKLLFSTQNPFFLFTHLYAEMKYGMLFPLYIQFYFHLFFRFLLKLLDLNLIQHWQFIQGLHAKASKNSSVVPNKSGRPGASNLPSSFTRLYSTNLLTAWSQETPRIFSISTFVIGCLYAIIESVSKSTSVSTCFSAA